MNTMIFKKEEMLELCKTDAIKNSILEFKHVLASHKGKFMPHLDADYRFYVSSLLSLSAESVDEELKAKIFSEIVIPSQKTQQ